MREPCDVAPQKAGESGRRAELSVARLVARELRVAITRALIEAGDCRSALLVGHKAAIGAAVAAVVRTPPAVLTLGVGRSCKSSE